MKYQEYQRKMKRLVFYTENFDENHLPSNWTLRQYQDELSRLQKETEQYEKENRHAV